MRQSWVRSLRFRLVLAAVAVEVVMLTILVANTVRVLEDHLIRQAEVRLRELEPLLNASLAAPLAERDYGTLENVLTQIQQERGLKYLALLDSTGRLVAQRGWEPGKPFPEVDKSFGTPDGKGIFNTVMPIAVGGEVYGTLRLGMYTRFVQQAKTSVLQQGAIIALLEVILSFALLTAIGFWLTRHLGLLTRASEQVALGNFSIRVPERGVDEIGRLSRTFNLMAEAVESRIKALSENESRFHAIADYTYDWESWVDLSGKLVWVNPSVERMTGYTPQECLSMERFPLPLVAAGDQEKAGQQFQRAIEGYPGTDFEFRVRRKDGSVFWAAANWQPIYSARRERLGIRASIRDITALKESEWVLRGALEELRQSEEKQRRFTEQVEYEQARLVSLLSAMNMGILFASVDNRVVYYNPAFLRIWMIPGDIQLAGRPSEEVLKHSANVLARPDHFSKHVLQVLDTHEVSENFEIQMADGRVVTQLSYPVRDKEGRFIGRLWIYEDVTRERQTAEQLIYLAERDSLTGLYNRHRFQEELSRMITDSERHHSGSALLFFDLDEFKYINDTFGHRAGDAMLIRVAGEVGALVRRNEVFARLGGDEFALLVPDVTEEEARTLAERIVRAIAQIPFRFEGQNLRLTTSLGIALYPRHAANAEELVAHADAAMYQAKEAGKNAWRLYRQDLDASREMVRRLSWNERISHALDNNLMRLHFQGVYHTHDGSLSHLEVLVRMVDQEDAGRLIMPAHFIRFAEKSGKILDIDRWVIRESIALLAQSDSHPPLAVNISGRSFDEPTLPAYIAEQLAHHNVSPRRLLVELTETAAISDLHDAERFIEALHQTGCQICLDDFGTGFSSFAYLKHLKADILKIDGLFIRNLPNDRDNQVFVKSIVDVARGMRKQTIAEFVEDAETLTMLKRFGVDMVQGYHLDTPRMEHVALQRSVG